MAADSLSGRVASTPYVSLHGQRLSSMSWAGRRLKIGEALGIGRACARLHERQSGR